MAAVPDMAAAQFTTLEPRLVVQSCLIWGLVFFVMVYAFRKIADACFSSMPAEQAYIPKSLPHPNPDGTTMPFEVRLTEASVEHVAAFMTFRGVAWTPTDGLGIVAIQAAKYKGEQFDTKVLKWEHDHFQLQKKGLCFPIPAKHWYGWTGFWAEVGPYRRGCVLGNLAVGFEHVLCGLILPLAFLWTNNVWYFAWSMYGDIGANIVSNALIAISFLTGKNYLLEQYSKAVWHLVAIHHCCAILLCSLGLLYGDATPRDLSCLLIISLLGTTGALHLFGIALDMTPWGIEDAPWARVLYQLVTFLSMVFFRVAYWIVLVYQVIQHAHRMGGWLISMLTFVVLLLFTAINADLVRYHYKALTGGWKRLQSKKKETERVPHAPDEILAAQPGTKPLVYSPRSPPPSPSGSLKEKKV